MARVIIELRIKGNEDDALDVVDRVLDAGTLQEAINNYQRDEGSLFVQSALVRPARKARS